MTQDAIATPRDPYRDAQNHAAGLPLNCDICGGHDDVQGGICAPCWDRPPTSPDKCPSPLSEHARGFFDGVMERPLDAGAAWHSLTGGEYTRGYYKGLYTVTHDPPANRVTVVPIPTLGGAA